MSLYGKWRERIRLLTSFYLLPSIFAIAIILAAMIKFLEPLICENGIMERKMDKTLGPARAPLLDHQPRAELFTSRVIDCCTPVETASLSLPHLWLAWNMARDSISFDDFLSCSRFNKSSILPRKEPEEKWLKMFFFIQFLSQVRVSDQLENRGTPWLLICCS